MKHLFLACLLWVVFADSNAQNAYPLIPTPASLTTTEGKQVIKKGMVISFVDSTLLPVVTYLQEQMGAASLSIKWTPANKRSNAAIHFILDNSLPAEGYRIQITSKQTQIASSGGAGAFFAVQSIMQLLSANTVSDGSQFVQLPLCTINDQPRYSYRGLMLDVGRHFFSVDEVKRFIDIMSLYKLNTLHWHLTEDQGWRIEIKKYPLLTKIASVRKESMVGAFKDQKFDKTPYGGFYTQDQIREVVAYAAKKFITIVPEIEMPGHSQALLAAYPQFGCNPDKIYEVRTKWGVSEDVLCPREETFQFVEDVLTEVMDLFPGQYIHIGGDECPKTQWKESRFCQNLIKQLGLKDEHELQSYFIRRVDKFITSKGRRLIGWDEILEGGLSPNATVMSWRGVKGGMEAAKQKHDVVMSPNSHFYLDYYQGDPKGEPLAIGGNLPLSRCYSFEPELPELTATEATYIKGVQANVWTEYISTFSHVEYMTYPRAIALAEVGWSQKGNKDFPAFLEKLKKLQPLMDKKGINYSKTFLKQQ
ncbi:MAG: beta-N-acetylglucosaminidase [Chitinophagia bacterium]|nr:beta-N-acetylglucosaminidase [Chitinophagia bacterium]